MSQLAINTILENIQTIFEQANTLTASVDLSSNLTNRVQNIVKYSPSFVEVGRDNIPAVHAWIESKSVDFKDISINQSNGRREANLDIKVAGLIAVDTFYSSDVNKAEENCRYLMENIEEIMRNNDKLSNSVDRHRIIETTYFDLPYDDGVTFKAAVSTFNAFKFY